MKDRYKIVLITSIIAGVLALLFIFMGLSFRKVYLRNYGLEKYDYFDTLDPNQVPRSNGNYLIGLDHSFVQFPKGFLTHEFSLKILTKDKSLIEVEGIFIGKLIYTELVNLYFSLGLKYKQFLDNTVQQLFREALEQFTLNQLVVERTTVDQYVRNFVTSSVQAEYQWLSTKLVSLGAIETRLISRTLSPDQSIQQIYLRGLNQTLQSQKKLNIYESGGYQLLSNIESYHSQLFKNVTENLQIVANSLRNLNKSQQVLPASQFIINAQALPFLKSTVKISMLG